MTTAIAHTFQGHDVRHVIQDGEPVWIGKDVCDVVGISKYRDALAQLDDDERASVVVDTLGGPQAMTAVTESGVWSLMLISRSPVVTSFKRWLTAEVLPQIRRTGAYSSAPPLTGPELVATALIEASRMLEAKDERLAELEPKAELADTYLTAQGGARLVRQVAKTFGMKESELRRFLLDEGLVFVRHAQCGDLQYDHYAHAAHYFLPRETVVTHQWGSCSHYTLYVLPRGVELIADRLRRSRSIEEPARS
jgi:anti-repressor protein